MTRDELLEELFTQIQKDLKLLEDENGKVKTDCINQATIMREKYDLMISVMKIVQNYEDTPVVTEQERLISIVNKIITGFSRILIKEKDKDVFEVSIFDSIERKLALNVTIKFDQARTGCYLKDYQIFQ